MDRYKGISEQDLHKLKGEIDRFASKYSLSMQDVLKLFDTSKSIPVSIFSDKLSPFETIVKYLKENLEMRLADIARLLDKELSACWTAYRNACSKSKRKFSVLPSKYDIPLDKFAKDLSLLENVCVYLKDDLNLSYKKIGDLIGRNERTVWTVVNRAKKRRGKAGKR